MFNEKFSSPIPEASVFVTQDARQLEKQIQSLRNEMEFVEILAQFWPVPTMSSKMERLQERMDALMTVYNLQNPQTPIPQIIRVENDAFSLLKALHKSESMISTPSSPVSEPGVGLPALHQPQFIMAPMSTRPAFSEVETASPLSPVIAAVPQPETTAEVQASSITSALSGRIAMGSQQRSLNAARAGSLPFRRAAAS